MEIYNNRIWTQRVGKLAKNLTDFLYWTCKPGSSVSNKPETKDNCGNNALAHFKTNYLQCVSLGYLNINSVRNMFCSIPPLKEHNIDIFARAAAKLDSLFPKS